MFLAAMLSIQMIYAATAVTRYTVRGNEVYKLDQEGVVASSGAVISKTYIMPAQGVKIGNSSNTPTAPTSSTGANYGIKVPYTNAGSTTIAAGAVVMAGVSALGTVNTPGLATSVLSTSTWIGINESSLASGATGYMTVSGLALVLTTGTVAVGDLLISSVTHGSTTQGYAGALISPSTGTLAGNPYAVIGKALSVGTASGGLTLIKLND